MSSFSQYLKAHGTTKTSVKTADGETFTLNGKPAKYTPSAVVKLADKNFKITVKEAKGEVAGATFRPRTIIAGEAEIAGMLKALVNAENNEQTESEEGKDSAAA